WKTDWSAKTLSTRTKRSSRRNAFGSTWCSPYVWFADRPASNPIERRGGRSLRPRSEATAIRKETPARLPTSCRAEDRLELGRIPSLPRGLSGAVVDDFALAVEEGQRRDGAPVEAGDQVALIG